MLFLKIVRWVLMGLVLLFALVLLPSISSFLLAIAAILIAPIEKLQKGIRKILPSKWLLIILILLLVFTAFMLVPSSPQSEGVPPSSDDSQSVEDLFGDRWKEQEAAKGNDDAADEKTDTEQIVISKETRKMHLASCSFVNKIKEDNRLISESTVEKLLSEGYVPCAHCMPDVKVPENVAPDDGGELEKDENKPTDKPAEDPTDKPAEDPTDEPAEDPTDEPTENPTEDPTEDPTDEPAEDPAEDPTDEPTENPTEKPDGRKTYVLNTSSKKFHYESCYTVKRMSEKNKEVRDTTYEELIAQGYVPCDVCNPR